MHITFYIYVIGQRNLGSGLQVPVPLRPKKSDQNQHGNYHLRFVKFALDKLTLERHNAY